MYIFDKFQNGCIDLQIGKKFQKLKYFTGPLFFKSRPTRNHSLAYSARLTTWPAPPAVVEWRWPLSFPHDPVPTISYPLRRFLLPRSRPPPPAASLIFPAASPLPCSSTRSLSPPRGKEERTGFWVTNAPLGRDPRDAHLLRARSARTTRRWRCSRHRGSSVPLPPARRCSGSSFAAQAPAPVG
jgi:hypothetical protein